MTPQELKNSILQLAIQGKLVEQRPEEGTAQELYAQIQAEKQRLIKEGKLKKEKPLPEITEDEKPFEIPEGWMWVRLSKIWTVINGDRGKNYPSKSKLSNNGIPFISAVNLDGKTVVKDDKLLCMTEEQYEKLGNGKLQRGDIVVCIRGSLGKHGIYPFEKGAIASSLVILRSYFTHKSIDDFLMLYLDSPLLLSEIKKYDNGTAQPNLSAKNLEQFLIPLPPLAEQKRIVSKIEELLPLVDRYEQAWTKLEDFNHRFPEDMKKSILQQAIQGKLVEQRPEEGNAQELYAQIQAEKQRLIKEGKIKKEKPLPEITEDEKPFEIPDGWMWVRLGSLLHFIDTGKSFKCDEVPPNKNQCGIIKVSAVTWGTFQEDESKTCYSDDSWVEAYAIHPGDFLICRANTATLVGGCVIVDDISKRLMLSDKVLRLHYTNLVCPRYALWALRTPLARNQFGMAATGTSESMKNISQDTIRRLVIPLPPLAEQKRIVARLEELLPLCEKLK